MRKLAIVAVILLLATQASAQKAPSEEPYWTPDAATITKLEAGLKITNYAKLTNYQLSQYDRYYAGVTINNQRAIRGILIVPPNREDNPKTGIHITDMQFMPRLFGGGCAKASVIYYVDQDRASGQCDLSGGYAPPSQLPHFKPEMQTATRMEAKIQDFLHRTHPKLPDLASYARYYRGVTIDGKPMIEGNIVMVTAIANGGQIIRPGDKGLYLVTEASEVKNLILDGGCDNIHVEYDVNAAKFTRLACDGERQMPLP